MQKEKEILNFFDIKVEHFPDRSARWLFQGKNNVQGLIEILAKELVELIDCHSVPLPKGRGNLCFVADALFSEENTRLNSAPQRLLSQPLARRQLSVLTRDFQTRCDISIVFL